MSNQASRKHVKSAPKTAPVLLPSRSERRIRAHEDVKVLAKAQHQNVQALDTLKQKLLEFAGLDDPSLEDLRQQQQLDQTRATLAQLRTLMPTLEREPDLLREAQEVVQQASLRLASVHHERARYDESGSGSASGGASGSGMGGILTKNSPTGSTPVASGNTAGVAWAGIGNRRTDAQGVPNAQYLRNLATKNPWVQAAITTRKQQIGRADITVMPMDETKRFDTTTQNAVERLLDYPNEFRDSYRSLMEPVIDDILTLDRGCISKDLDPRGIPHHLYVEDGATIRIYADWDGSPKKPRYVFCPPNSMEQIPLFNEQLICIMANNASYRYGLSPVQVLLDTIRSDLAATEKAMNLVKDVPPPTIVGVQGAGEETVRRMARQYERDVAGKKEIMFVGTTTDQNLQVFPLSMNLTDMQFMEWQEYQARRICAVFQISPQQIGLTFDINRATAQVQADITEDSGIIALMLLLEIFWNRELLADWAPVDKDGRPRMDALNLRVFYPEVSEIQRMRHAERVINSAQQALAGLPLLTPNEARAMLGEEPFPHGGNTLWLVTQQGAVPTVLSYDDDLGDYGEYGTAGELGAQDPAGGTDEQANAPTKPGKDEGGALGNDTSGNGEPPDSGIENAASGGSTSAASGASTSASASKSLTHPPHSHQSLPAPLYRRSIPDRRRPGKSWHPGLDPRGQPVVVKQFTTDRSMLPDKPVAKKHPKSLGHIRQEHALAHPQPEKVSQARRTLQRQVEAVFEAAVAHGTQPPPQHAHRHSA